MLNNEVDLIEEQKYFVDFVVPNLDVYEQAIFLYLMRHSILEGTIQVTISLKSDRVKIGLGAGDGTRPMSESTLTKKVNSLEKKGLVRRVNSGRSGTTLSISLPSHCKYGPMPPEEVSIFDIEEMDFFVDPKGREAILARENRKCFYCLSSLEGRDYVMEHVVSRPKGGNGYRNIVAACQTCNNQKSEKPADEYLRFLYRQGYLSGPDFQSRLEALKNLLAGQLVPKILEG